MDNKLLIEGFVITMKITNEVTVACLNEILRQQKEHKLDTLPDPELIEIAIKRFKSEQSLIDKNQEELVETILNHPTKSDKS